MLAQIKFNDLSPLLAAKKVVEQVAWFYGKGGIPTILNHKMVEEVQKWKKKLDGVAKQPVKYRKEPTAAFLQFKQDLDKTFKVWPRNAKEIMKIKEDIDFLISMEGDRKASIAGLDKNEEAFQKRKQEREEKRKEREEKMRDREERERKESEKFLWCQLKKHKLPQQQS